jgi:hypothetical protein
MSLASKVAVRFGAKTLVNAVGGAISSAYGIVSKTGKAIGEAGKALGSAAQNTKQSNTPSNNVIIANTGMAGSAGKQKVTGGGTLPAPKAVAKPQVSIKMPTEELLNTAVKYLSSIDRSLKAQLDFEKNSYQEQARAEREAIIENKPSTTFNDMKDRLSGLKSDTKDNSSIAGTILKYAAILGGAAALIASALDQKQLDALKENVEEFKKKFSWLGDLAAAGGIGYLGYKSLKSLKGLSGMRGGAASAGAIGGAVKTVGGLTAAEKLIKSSKWQKFLNWLTKNGKRKLVTKIQQRIAVGVTSGAIVATGIGAAFGAIGFLLNLGFNLYLMYEIYELWKSFNAEEDANKLGASDAEIAKAIKEPDATKVGGAIASSNLTSKSLGKVTPEMLSKTPQQLTTDELRTLVEAQGRIEDPRGVTNNPGGILYGTGPLKEHQVGSVGANADSSVRIAKYDTAENGIQAAMINWKTSKYAGKPIRDSLGMWSGGDGAKYESFLTGRPAQYTGSGTALTGSSDTSISGMVNSGAEQVGKIFGMLGSSIIKPGVARNFTPSGSNISEQISANSMKLQNDITFGIQREKSKDKITSPTIPAGTPRSVRPAKSVSYIDPNYQNINVLHKYLAHFRMAS